MKCTFEINGKDLLALSSEGAKEDFLLKQVFPESGMYFVERSESSNRITICKPQKENDGKERKD
jgi:hypothetical protein